ncbi:MAG: potassium channel protein [Deltaproteobacteria bacterium]|nr:potassium channel protein [Deltaproteobacteria bacterium]
MEVRDIPIEGKAKIVASLFFFIFVVGTLGFHFIEDWGILDSFFMTLITITTIGYREVQPLSSAGKVFDVFIIFIGVGTAAYGFATIAQLMIEGELQDLLGRRRLDKKIASMEQHYIICGNGRIGSLICKELKANDSPFVVIDSNPSTIEPLEQENISYIIGDATKEEILIRGGIKRAKCLIATAASDVTNVYITLIARELNPSIFILARAETEDSIRNIKRAGADRVVSPYMIGGRHMANIILKPTVVDFVELATGEKREDFYIQMEEFKINASSALIDKTLRDSPIRKDLGLTVVAIKGGEGDMIFNPLAEYSLSKGDILVCIGEMNALKSMRQLTGG